MSDYYGGYEHGGFSTSTTTTGSQPVSAGANSAAVRSSLTPVTIKQINESTQPVPDGPFHVNNMELNMVSFVGIIRKITAFESAISFTIEDGTGSTEIRKWINSDQTSKDAEEERYAGWLNTYVCVGGSLKAFNGKTSLQYSGIHQVTDSNQVVYHHLAAIHTHLKAQGVPSSSTKNEQSLFVGENYNNNNNTNTTGNAGASMIDQVFKILQENSQAMAEGVPVTYIGQRLNITPEEANKYCQELMEQGRVFNGYEDSGYLCL
ncbi:uncharacterized protein SPAPADRAFT_135817 [Spathaspora passalidarum NRRL Y-27907]|uniref:Replication protein A C-terminal domain-containing protein n=1 Tax=Spathaspora passalidarum (strain NRRL Y-27907 / 11-Y1) TaxID=619300 RepID=G3AKQ2_SPAPN|nr:uncharacterized protein SPAPADRAFT_135817 [Spathaspora passalidarum NRRL Y-27907]EGW32957.1 hypothetical protein SPAPADRAFT_135817 [Spathaspora passalidarum NRRL Y-27907]